MVSGITPPRGLIHAVYTQTEGNPLFVTEVVRLLVQEGELSQETTVDRDSWDVRIPEGVREVIGRRLNKLSERCNQTLTIAAVIGREFEMRQLEKLVENISSDRLLDVLEEGLKARVIEEMPDSVGVYQFTHALIQQTLFNELTTTRRVRLHARIIEELEELYGDNIEAHAVGLAYHAAEAESVIGPEKLVRYSLMAGERALTTYAYEEALFNYQRGLAAKGVRLTGTEPAEDAETAALLFGVGRARAGTLEMYQVSESADSLGRAFDYYAGKGDVDRAISVAEYPLPPVAGHRTGMSPLVTRALLLVPTDSHNAGHLLLVCGRLLAIEEGDYTGAIEAFDRALVIARREKDMGLEMSTLTDSAQADFHNLRWQACLDKSLRAVELAQRANMSDVEMWARFWVSFGLGFIGDLRAMRLNAKAMLALGEKVRGRIWSTTVLWVNESVASISGEWLAAREFSDRGLAVGPQDARLLATRAILECQVGDFAQGRVYLERLVEVMRLVQPGPTLEYMYCALAIPVVASFTGDIDQLDIAKEAAKIVISSSSATPNLVVGVRSGLAVLAILRSETGEAGEQYSALEATGATILRDGRAAERLLGLFAQTMGNLDDAAGHFENALAFCRKAGYRPELAWSLCDYAVMLLERNRDGDKEMAVAMLDESLAISTELGMRPLMERVLSRRDILNA